METGDVEGPADDVVEGSMTGKSAGALGARERMKAKLIDYLAATASMLLAHFPSGPQSYGISDAFVVQ